MAGSMKPGRLPGNNTVFRFSPGQNNVPGLLRNYGRNNYFESDFIIYLQYTLHLFKAPDMKCSGK